MDSAKLEFAYRYPFSAKAREVLEADGSTAVEGRYIEFGRERVDADIRRESRYYDIDMENIKLGEIKSYAYARMIVSAINNPIIIDRFCRGEAERARGAISNESNSNIIRLWRELGVRVDANADREFAIDFTDYLKSMPRGEEYRLVNSRLRAGTVILSRGEMESLLVESIYKRLRGGLPIPTKELPVEVVAASKGMRFDVHVRLRVGKSTKSMEWIESLLKNPIPDVRHRTVNLILAPYLTNVRGLEVEDAYRIIRDYVEECKKLNPDTKVNDAYIKYQCRYAKEHKMRPLSLSNAKTLLSGLVELE